MHGPFGGLYAQRQKRIFNVTHNSNEPSEDRRTYHIRRWREPRMRFVTTALGSYMILSYYSSLKFLGQMSKSDDDS